jgi:eukaryotic-like serine/threonine-protein kinase
MIRFQLLGSIHLCDETGRELRAVLAQPKRLAVLAYLAGAWPAGPHRRDTLLGMFWPELDQEHARNALSKAVHFLRRALGDEAIVSRSADELALDMAAVWTDVGAFRRALDSGQVDDALELYHGDLLPSFFVPDAPGFEEWLERERPRLRARAADAARLLAERHEAGRHPTLAVGSARRAVELSNGDERPLRRLIELLDRLGDRAGAVRAYEEFARWLTTDLEVEPAAETVALIERIKTSSLPRPTPSPAPKDSVVSEPAITRLTRAMAGRYKVERQVGAGAMAVVALAHDLRHHRRVAIKVLRPELSALMGTERFLREIDIAASLMHPHILPLHDSGEADGLLYYVMPYVEGESLRGRIDRERRLPRADALQIGREVVDALAYAHHRGFVHRDIKPENILLSDGHALVADFGIARAVGSAGGEELTARGLGTGTPAYMSPEQATGEGPVDERTDIYALGCVLFEMLAGEPPFVGRTTEETVAQRLSGIALRVSGVRNEVGSALDEAIAKALERVPRDRFANAATFAAALSQADHPRTADPRSSTFAFFRRWAPVSIVGAGTVLLAVVAGLSIRQPGIQIGRRTQVTLSPGLEIHPALSPRGDLLAYTAGNDSRLFVQQVEGGKPIAVAHELPGPQGWPQWSPDAKRLSFSSARGVEIAPALGGTPRLVAPGNPGVFRGAVAGPWSPDGRELAFVRADTLYAVSPDGGAPRPIAAGQALHSCSWSLDGGRIACVSVNVEATTPGPGLGNLAQSAIAIIPAAGGPPAKFFDDGYSNSSPVWLPDATLLFVSNREGGRDIYRVRFDSKGRPMSPQRITTGLNPLTITMSADGSRLGYAAFTETSNVWSIAVPPGSVASVAEAKPVTIGNQVIEGFDLSPDGHWLTFASDRSGNSDIYRVRLERGSEPEQLTRTTAEEFAPAWSPDGYQIAFHGFREGRRQIYTVPAEGGAPVRVAGTPDDDRSPGWAPDGLSLFLLSNAVGVNPETRFVERNTDGSWSAPTRWRKPACGPSWSPNRLLAACIELSGRLMLTDSRGDSLRVLVDSVGGLVRLFGPSWSTDGRTVYYLKADSLETTIQAVPATGGKPRVMLRFDDPTRPWHRYGFQVFRDRFYFTVGDRQSDIWVAEVGNQ